MKIADTETFILHVPVPGIADSQRSVERIEFVGLRVRTACGMVGTGWFATVGHGAAVVKCALDTLLADEIIGEDPRNVRDIWSRLYSGKGLWIGRAGAVHVALSAIDIALWDLCAKHAGLPLWRLLGGDDASPFPAYNTNGGWLNFSVERLRDEALRQIDDGFSALKIKVGGPDLDADIARVEAVRAVIGNDILLMADANQNWDLTRAQQAVQRLESFDLGWIEEPLHPDDIDGHARLNEACRMPLALGENVYSSHLFDAFIARGAVDVVQVDACRVGGITPWLDVAEAAAKSGLQICPHAGDIGQIHQHLVRANSNAWMLEVIPFWDEGPFEDQLKLKHGACLAPDRPGASTEFGEEAFTRFRVA
ncbi:mandelate racemase/muconate lactonizing enzyme family protein [Croceicoccus sediminis]|uniref:mandelate racemase/muconate lactonizing enzyme family protein n=1 Tax=Croceicoccus sediminis TaxID=2571150 RepID=UPI00118441CA|nr:mandelate racemase/muconate lactonizing enzyme family protein [Croceicoccus sediminis]